MRKRTAVFYTDNELKEIKDAAKSLGIDSGSAAARSLSLMKAREINNKQVNKDERK